MYYTIEVIKVKGKARAVRAWRAGWFPVNPVKGIDVVAR